MPKKLPEYITTGDARVLLGEICTKSNLGDLAWTLASRVSEEDPDETLRTLLEELETLFPGGRWEARLEAFKERAKKNAEAFAAHQREQESLRTKGPAR